MNIVVDIHMYGHKKKTTVSWTMVTPNGGVCIIYRGLYEMVVGGYLLVHTKELMKDFCSRVFVVCRLVNHRQTHYTISRFKRQHKL